MPTTLFVSQSLLDHHSIPPSHPESPLRPLSIETILRQSGLWADLGHATAVPATTEAILTVHPARYLEQLRLITPKKGTILADSDTPMAADTLHAAMEAAGAGIMAVEAVLRGDYKNAFCAVRPPGHHAEPSHSKGFCFLNNIAIAAQHALQNMAIKRLCIFDFDVHQCNGTIEALGNHPDVLIVSSFQHPLYPFSHYYNTPPNVLNIPLHEGCDGLEYRQRCESIIIKTISHFRPEMILVSAGFDAHKMDPLGGLNLLEDDFRWITQLTQDLAKTYCNGKIVSMLEGGYDLEALAKSAHEHIRVLSEV